MQQGQRQEAELVSQWTRQLLLGRLCFLLTAVAALRALREPPLEVESGSQAGSSQMAPLVRSCPAATGVQSQG